MATRFTPLAPEDPREVGGYPLRARLGGGGMGLVYLSFTPGGRALAIKVIRPEHTEDEAFRRRFEREVTVAQRVQGLFTAPVVDADPTAALPWLATAYVPGPSLRDAVTDHGVLPPLTVFRLVAGVAEGLLAVHACEIIHRDLKPANVLLAEDGPRVIDFGIAHAAEATSLTSTGLTVGTPAFMAPELVRGGSATPATDVFGLGHLAVFAATGRAAFGEGDRDALMYRIAHEPPDLDGCPDEVRAIATRCLAKDPDERPGLTEVRDFARQHTSGQTLNLTGPWLPTAIADTLAAYDAAAYRRRTLEAGPGAGDTPPGQQPWATPSGGDHAGMYGGGPGPAGGPAPIGGPNPVHPVPTAPGRGQWVKIATALAAFVAVVVAVAFIAYLTGPKKLPKRDDTLYPQEIKSILHMSARDELLQWSAGSPKPLWTTPIKGGDTDVIGGDSTIVMLRFDTYLLGINMRTGRQQWPFINLHDAPLSCAVRENRIGCVAPASNGSDSTVFILDTGSGRMVKTMKVPNQDLRTIVVSGDRFIAVADSPGEKKGFAVGYTTEGDQVWAREGHNEMYVSAGERILVDSAFDADDVVFVGAADGREVLRVPRPSENRDLTWNVFDTGIAVQSKDGTGTDIYDLEGKKRSSVAGWGPVGYQNRYAPTSPLPLLNRLGDRAPYYPDDHTIAAANPKTGHLLWRISGPELSRQMATVDDKLIMKVTATGAPQANGQFVRVYNCMTGEPLSPVINMTRPNAASVEVYWIESDGLQLVYAYIGGREKLPWTTVGYDIRSGKKRWELPMENRPGYPGGRIVGAGKTETISVFQ